MFDLKKWIFKVNDRLNGLLAASFSPPSRTITDADDAPNGIVYCSANIANIPENYVILITTTVNGYRLQLAYQMSLSPTKLYMRKKEINGSWTAWTYASFTNNTSQEVISADTNHPYLGANCIARKQGNIIHLYISTLKGLPQNTSVVLFTLPAGYRTPNTIEYDAFTVTSTPSGSRHVRIAVAPNGEVKAYNYSTDTGNLNLRGNITYIVTNV